MKYSFLPIYHYVLEVGYTHYLFSLVPKDGAVDVKLIKRVKVVEKKTKSLAEKISAKRKATAEVFSQSVCQELKYLDMPNICFKVNITKGRYIICP